MPIMDTHAASEHTGVPIGTLRYWRSMGQGPKSFTLGKRKVMYRDTDLDAWLEAQYEATVVGEDADDVAWLSRSPHCETTEKLQ